MSKLAFFICAHKAFGAKTVDNRTGARTSWNPFLQCQAYRCKGPDEFQKLNTAKVSHSGMWSAVLVDDNGALRQLTDADTVATLEAQAASAPIIPQEPEAPTEKPAAQDVESVAEITPPVITEPVIPEPQLPSEPDQTTPVLDDKTRILAELTKGPVRLGSITAALGIAPEIFQSLAEQPDAAFTISGPAKWVKLK